MIEIKNISPIPKLRTTAICPSKWHFNLQWAHISCLPLLQRVPDHPGLRIVSTLMPYQEWNFSAWDWSWRGLWVWGWRLSVTSILNSCLPICSSSSIDLFPSRFRSPIRLYTLWRVATICRVGSSSFQSGLWDIPHPVASGIFPSAPAEVPTFWGLKSSFPGNSKFRNWYYLINS